ncbi:unnamed protein product, partial [Rotaria sp. Silwood2]
INEIHTHFIDSNATKILELRQKLKKEVQTTSAPVDKIVEIAYSTMITEEKINDSIPKLLSIKTLKNTVGKQRHTDRPSLPKYIEDLTFPLPTLYTLTKDNESFLLFDGQLEGKRGLIFA